MPDALTPTLVILLGSSPKDDGTLDPATHERVEHVAQLWVRGMASTVVCMGRHSNPNWEESEAACARRHLLARCTVLGKPMPANRVRADDRPKSTAQSLMLIPEWEAWFSHHGLPPTRVSVVTNEAYRRQYIALRNGQNLAGKTTASLHFEAAPNFAMKPADHRRLKLSDWKARVDPYDKWINQWRLSRQPRLVKLALTAADIAILVGLTLLRKLGRKPSPGRFPARKLHPDGSIR